MMNFLNNSKSFFEKLDGFRDKLLFFFIKKYWPRAISPNHLTAARIIIGISLFFILFYYKNDGVLLIFSLFSLGAILDLLDGSIARALNKKTKLGVVLDPVADRILIVPIAFYSLFHQHIWLLISIMVLEIINALMSLWAQSRDIFIESNIFGKIKMLLQSVAFMGLLIFLSKTPMIFIYLLWLSTIIMAVSIFAKFIELKTLNERKTKNI